jgi:hypothetical protein
MISASRRGLMSALLITAGASLVAGPAFAQAAAAKIDAADTAWMISATGLVLMMTIPGLALFYAGMVRKKNVRSMAKRCNSACVHELAKSPVARALFRQIASCHLKRQ